MCTILRHPRANMSWASIRIDRLQGELDTVLRHGLDGEALGELVERLSHAVEHREHTARWLMLRACCLGADLAKPPPVPFEGAVGLRLVGDR